MKQAHRMCILLVVCLALIAQGDRGECEPAVKTVVTVTLRPEGRSGGLSTSRSRKIQASISSCENCNRLIHVADPQERSDFEIQSDIEGSLELVDSDGRVRKTFSKTQEDENARTTLMGLAVQRLLTQIIKMTNGTLGGGLEIRALPRLPLPTCTASTWNEPEADGTQLIPLCSKWQVNVRLSSQAADGVYVTAILLGNDGTIASLVPQGSQPSFLLPGKDFTFPAILTAAPPVGISEEVIVFGSKASAELNNIIDERFQKLQALAAAASEALTKDWIAVGLPLKVKVNDPFKSPVGDTVDKREYTMPKFDIRPYLPDDKGTALYRVLQEANWLVNFSPTSGIKYHQGWDANLDDEGNLKNGIDCSRAIWFAFTRANLPYNYTNAYLSTADMVMPKSLMKDDFDRVSLNETFRIGDILVYRNDEKGVGHVVMVIDPSERIAWGSHGFDGRIRTHEVSVPETGAQYQKIRYKPDWRRWDRIEMSLKACWRYRKFASDFDMPGGRPGLRSLTHACDQASCTN